MAYKKADDTALTRHNILLAAGDFDKIDAAYPRQASKIIRALVRSWVAQNVDKCD